jgi:glycosyltransferase involved in cell wall biosynthesis
MVILEAMAAKKPVVATNRGGPVEILNNGECGILVPPKDGKAIAEACLKYFNDPIFRQSMVEKAYERLNKDFYIERTVEKTLSLFERVNDSRYNKKEPVC